jgi:ectoine hydroxylase-related dioxygenase (phytanoyl-CoA dioxygenase family)
MLAPGPRTTELPKASVIFFIDDGHQNPHPTKRMTNDGNSSFHFRIPVVDSDETDHTLVPNIPQELIDSFREEGFVVFPNVASTKAVDALNDRLEDVLRGHYDRDNKPDKTPKLLKSEKPRKAETAEISSNKTKKKKPAGPIGFSGNLQNVKVLQIINIHKADSLFRKLETNVHLGQVVAELAGWKHGARLAQDQIWAKPPGAPPLVFHRDSPYFMFEPSDVVTVWFALDDMDPELGPLEYVRKSHLWGDGRVGSSSQFFQANVKKLLYSAAEREGIDPEQLDFVSMAGLKGGGMSIHHGKVWHGSSKNNSKNRPRRGLGMHFVPAEARFTSDASHSRLWGPYVENMEDPSQEELPNEDFPLVWSR